MKYVVFDGDCGVCSAVAEFIIKNKKNEELLVVPSYDFNFEEFGIEPAIANFTVIWIESEKSRIYFRTRAVMEILKNIRGPFQILGYLFANPVFSFIFNPVYNLIAKNRAFISSKMGLTVCKLKN